MTKKIFSVLLCAAMMLGVFAGCGKTDPSAPTTGGSSAGASNPTSAGSSDKDTEKTYTIAVMVKDSSTPFWRYLVSGAMEAGKDLGVEVVEYAPMEA